MLTTGGSAACIACARLTSSPYACVRVFWFTSFVHSTSSATMPPTGSPPAALSAAAGS